MFYQIKRLVRHTAIYGISDLLGRAAIGFILLPLYTRKLSVEEIGLMTLAFIFIAFVEILYSLGMRAAVLRYFADREEGRGRQEIFSTTFISLLTLSLVLSSALWILSDSIAKTLFGVPGYRILLRMISGILLLDTLSLVSLVVLRALERSGVYAAITLSKFLLTIGLNIYLILFLGKRLEGVFESNLIASAFVFLVALPFGARYLRPYISWETFRNLLSFGLPYVPAVLALMVIDLSDRYLLKMFSDLEQVGLYSVGYKFGIIALLLVKAFSLAWPPFFLSISKQEGAKEICARVMTYFLLAAAFLFLGISIFAKDLIRIFAQPQYLKASNVVPLVTLAYIMYGVYINLIVGIYLKNKTGYLPFITGGGALINIVLNLLLIPPFGMMGAAVATLASYVTMAISLYFVTDRLYPINYEFGRIGRLSLAASLVVGAALIGGWENPGIKVGLLAGYFPLLWALGFFEDQELARLKSAILELRPRAG